MSRGSVRTTVAANTLPVAVLLIAALVYWRSILVDPVGRIAGGNGDPLFIAYIVTWVATHFGDAALWNPPFFHPATNVLAYSEHFLGLSAVAWPLVAVGASPIVIVNLLAVLASVVTSAALYIWLRDSGFSAMAAGATALTVTYSAWRHLQISHLQLQWLGFLPVALLCYSRAIEGRAGLAWVWAGGAALALQTLFTTSLGVSIMPLAIVWLIAASFLARRTSLIYWAAVVGSIAIVGLVNLPIARHYWQVSDALDRTTAEIASHSATWIDWISAQHHWLYGNALHFTRGGERELFAGVGWIAVAVIGAVATLRAARPLPLAGLLTAALAFWATTGVNIDGFTWANLPYELFRRVMPGGEQVRVPVRFVLLGAVFLAPAIAAGWTFIHAVVARRLPSMAQWIAFLLAAVVVAEGLAGVAWFEPAWAQPPTRIPVMAAADAVLVVPLAEAAGPRREIARMWSARRAGVPIVNGYSGNESALYRRLRDLQAAAPNPAVQRALYTLLHHHGVKTIVAERPMPSMIDESVLVQIEPGVFRIPDAVPQARVDRFQMGRDAGLILTESGWSYPERNEHESWVWSVQPRATLQVPLGGVTRRQISLLARSQSAEGDRLELWWNGHRLGVHALGPTPMLHSFSLPDAASAANWIDVEVRGPRPVRLPGNPDPRSLGVCVFEIRLE
jgi:hypothetical protein